MKSPKIARFLMLLAVICFSTLNIIAKERTVGNITMTYEELSDGKIKVISVKNNADKKIEIIIDRIGESVSAYNSKAINKIAYEKVIYQYTDGHGKSLWIAPKKKEKPREEQVVIPREIPERKESKEPVAIAKETPERKEASDRKDSKSPSLEEPRGERDSAKERNESSSLSRVPVSYAERIYLDPFFGTDAVNAYLQKVDELTLGIESAKDKRQYIIDNDIKQWLTETGNELAEKRSNIADIAEAFVRESNIDASNRASTINLIVETLSSRLKTREEAYTKLNNMVNEIEGTDSGDSNNSGETIINSIIIILILAVIGLLIFIAIRRKKNNQKSSSIQPISKPSSKDEPSSGNPSIVVKRRTTAFMKRQSLDDVIDNPDYLLINASEFAADSAVNKIYIKNSCIKDVYNLYAEDLRNSDNPKEDGCMVIGRWVHDENNHTYDISLEEVVFPGDDAIFKEYELNFGGKIKLRIAERLRKLRRETNLQYDLICWIHSHPGLGVFFSNSDDTVQQQLKHSQHPNFLIAFVVDILTSDQEMGIFTFRKDGSMNSKGDLIKMYSLEEMYKWALQSERNSFSHQNYYNILGDAKMKMPACKGVELNNSAIIDLTQLLVEPANGIVGWAIGTTIEGKSSREYAVIRIVRDSEKPGAGVLGCLISMTNMSMPTIQRVIASHIKNISFVMIHSTKQSTLTTIPVINGELMTDPQYHGEVNIDDLKIWTRRKR